MKFIAFFFAVILFCVVLAGNESPRGSIENTPGFTQSASASDGTQEGLAANLDLVDAKIIELSLLETNKTVRSPNSCTWGGGCSACLNACLSQYGWGYYCCGGDCCYCFSSPGSCSGSCGWEC